jgi:hypothetical protein
MRNNEGAQGTAPGEEKMLTFEDVKNAVLDSNDLWRAGREREALELLNNRIGTARQDNSAVQAKILALHASVIAKSAGDLDAARSYLEQVLIYEPGNALALFGIADILENQGKSTEAKDLATHSYSIAAASNTDESRGLLELLVKKWPDVGPWSTLTAVGIGTEGILISDCDSSNETALAESGPNRSRFGRQVSENLSPTEHWMR